jgi:hypothetical protein
MRGMLKRPSLLLILFLLVGCNLSNAAQTQDLIPPSPTTITMLRGTAVPTLERLYSAIAAPTLNPTGAAPTETPAPICGFDETTPTTQHKVNAVLDYPTREIEVEQDITFINRSPSTLNDVVFNVEPNRYPGAFTLTSITQTTGEGAQTPEFELTGRRLSIKLVEPLEGDCALRLQLQFTINVPPVSTGVQAFRGFFGYSPRQINLGHWLPTVALRVGDDWITRQAVFVGEQEVLTKADWDVTIKVENSGDTLMIAAPGEREEIAANHWHYHSPNSRDFTLSLSEEFRVNKTETKGGVTLEVYTFGDAIVETGSGRLDGAAHAVSVAVESLESYSELFGAYPYKRLLVVQGDFPDGMEFSGLVFVSTDWFTRYTGDPASFLTLITVHEVAHQWWYARVGNDPALAPWLDEALATYSEYIYLEEFYPELKSWWWEFRVDNYSPGGFVDSTVYEFSSIREYINAVYLRGVKMLHTLRQDLGTEAFFDWLRRYAEAGAGEVVTPNFFWSLLSPEQLGQTALTRQTYLRAPNVQP